MFARPIIEGQRLLEVIAAAFERAQVTIATCQSAVIVERLEYLQSLARPGTRQFS